MKSGELLDAGLGPEGTSYAIHLLDEIIYIVVCHPDGRKLKHDERISKLGIRLDSVDIHKIFVVLDKLIEKIIKPNNL